MSPVNQRREQLHLFGKFKHSGTGGRSKPKSKRFETVDGRFDCKDNIPVQEPEQIQYLSLVKVLKQ